MLKQTLMIGAALLPMMAAAADMTPANEMPAGEYTLDKTHASVTWKVNHLGLSNYTARFTDIDATLHYDPKDVTKSKVTATIDPLSIETDFPATEKEDFNMKLAEGEDWFNAGKFPAITFKSTKVSKTGENTGVMTGDLTMLGETKPVMFDVVFNGAYAKKPFSNAPAMGFSAKANIKRSDWGFDTYVPMIGDDITILLETEFGQKAEEAKAE
ncbi:MAG: YceI family protein [Rickettsiales bacterium]|nr:YceI family protein [Rickettsiales bacterium]